MAEPTPSLERAARRAYELGRLRSSLWVLPIAAAIAVVSWFCCDSANPAPFVLGPALGLTSVGLLWKGMAWAKGVVPGLIAGGAAFACPVVLDLLSCSWLQCVTACVVGGVLASIAIVVMAFLTRALTVPFLVGGLVVTTLCGSLGCAIAGWMGVLALIAGLGLAVGFAMPWIQRHA